MTQPAFNPLLAAVKTPSRRQSREVAPPPLPSAGEKMDTTTPAAPPAVPRRFDLGDLPRFEAKMFPILQEQFPHLNARMYGGWLRGCVTDNSCCFMCMDNPAGVIMAHMYQKPMNPVPLVEIDFVIGVGSTDAGVPLLAHVIKWAHEIGAPKIITSNVDLLLSLKKVKSPFIEELAKEELAVVYIKA